MCHANESAENTSVELRILSWALSYDNKDKIKTFWVSSSTSDGKLSTEIKRRSESLRFDSFTLLTSVRDGLTWLLN